MTTLAPSAMPFAMYPSTRSNCSFETTGPKLVFSEEGSPVTTDSATRLAIASTSANFPAGTNMRVGALQDCPEFWNTWSTLFVTARSKSASSSSTLGDLPPSSWCTRLTEAAAFLATSVPARVDPVKHTMSTSRATDSAAPTLAPSPLIRLNTPAGNAASSNHFPQQNALKRKYLAGL